MKVVDGGKTNWAVPTGTLEQFDGLVKLEGHEHIQDTLDGGFADFLVEVDGQDVERWPGHFRKGTTLPQSWHAFGADSLSSRPDAVPAHCLCKAVKFWVSYPSETSTQANSPWPDVLIPDHSDQPRPQEPSPWWLQQEGMKFLAGVCACNSCRLGAGMNFVEWAFVPTIDIKMDQAGEESFKFNLDVLTEYRSTAGPKGARRYFCKTCGAIAFFQADDRTSMVDVAVGMLAAPEGARAESLLHWECDRLSFREDAIDRAGSQVKAVEAGLKQYGAHRDPH